jgi:ABC exporter DevB family membrane fusion protein
MNRNTMLSLAVVASFGGGYYFLSPKIPVPTVAAATTGSAQQSIVAAAGRVEPFGEEVRIASELDGRLKRVLVDEGQSVRKGQVLAELENGDFAARVAIAKAAILEREVALRRLENGSRKQERRESKAGVREFEVILENTSLERDRRRVLLERGAISRTEFDSADREYQVARARLDAARERDALVEDQTRPEDLDRARAEIDSAKARLEEANAMLLKTIITSPIDAVVLRRKLKSGESVSSKGEIPIVTLGEIGRLRIRADVDEVDVARLALGQKAWVTATAYGEQKFTGRIVQIGQALGRKNVRTDEPTERVDVKILETLIELDPGQTRLPVGLRVDTFIEAGSRKD